MSEVFSKITSIDHPLLGVCKVIFLTNGEEHLVYELPDHPALIFKINIDSVLHGSVNAQTDQERHDLLKQVYGKDHVLETKVFSMNILFDKEIVEEARKIKKIDTPASDRDRKADVVTLLQARFQGLGEPRRRFISSRISEMYDIPEEIYKNVTKKLVFKIDINAQVSIKELCEVQDNRWNRMYPLYRLLSVISEDEGLKRSVQDFIERTLKYIDASGYILDLAGKHSMAFVPSGTGWTYVLIDVLAPTKFDFKDIKKLLQDFNTDSWNEETNILLCYIINFIRVMNGISEHVGLRKPFNQLDGVEIDLRKLYEYFNKKYGLSLDQAQIATFKLPDL